MGGEAVDLDDAIAAEEKKALRFQRSLRELKADRADSNLRQSCDDMGVVSLPRSHMRISRTLKSHMDKVVAIDWSRSESATRMLVSASQDGSVLLWDAVEAMKKGVVELDSPWIVCASLSSTGRMLATGGLSNICSLYDLYEEDESIKSVVSRPTTQMMGHEAFISSAKFIQDNQLITSSGDCTIMAWDVASSTRTSTWTGHTQEINCMEVLEAPNLFATVSADGSTRVWDTRVPTDCVRIFAGSAGDVTALTVVPSNQSLMGTGDDRGILRVLDMRSDREVVRIEMNRVASINNSSNRATSSANVLDDDQQPAAPEGAGITSVAFSKSGRVLFAAHEAFTHIVGWDVLLEEEAVVLHGHSQRVSALAVDPVHGQALASSSWDRSVRLWA